MDATHLIPSATNINYGAADAAKPSSNAFLALNEVPIAKIATDQTMINIAGGNARSISIAFSIIKSIVGCGILSLPWSTAIIGLIPCIVLITISFAISFICWMYLVICSQHLRVYEYRDIGLKLYGMKFAVFVDIILVILSCLYCVLYSVYIGEFIANGLVEYGLPINTQLITQIPINSLMDLVQTKFFILTIVIFGVLFPLTLLPKLDSLKYTSLIGISGTIFIVVYISYVCVCQDVSHIQLINTHDDKPGTAGLYWLEAFGIFSAVFFGHFNTAPMYGELKCRSIPKMFRVTLVSFIIVAFINIFMIVSSYGIFGVHVEQNVIESLSTNALTNHTNVIAALRILMSLNMIGSYPLLFWNAKIALKTLFYKDAMRPLTPLSESEPATKSILHSNAVQRFMYFLITVAIWLAAIFVDQVGIILSFIQATVGNLILFIFPSLFYYRLTKQHKWLCCFIVSFGFIAMAGGIISSLLSMFNVLS